MSADLEKAAQAIETFLRAIGAPDNDPELVGTGKRVAEAYANELLAGYTMDPATILSDTVASERGDVVIVRDVQTATLCPHHLMPASGRVHVGYRPGKQVVGLGAITRLVECFARRFALQEDLGQNISDALVEHLGASGAGCAVDLSPTCMTARGSRSHGARAVTFAWAGQWASDPGTRAEFLAGLSDLSC